MVTTLNVALIGVGRIGQVHAKTLAYRLPNARLGGIADIKPQLAQETAQRFGGVHWTTEPLELINNAAIEAVVIASPNETHADYIIAAAQAGKPIFCEKPIDRDIPRTLAALAAVQAAGVPLMLGFQRRCDVAHMQSQRAVAEGRLGQVIFARSHTRDPEAPPADAPGTSGGIFRETCVHDFDGLRYILGDEIVELTALANVGPEVNFLARGRPDIAAISVRFSRGALGQIDAVRGILYGYDVRTEIVGTAATVMGGYHRDTPVTEYRPEGVTHDHVFWFPQRFAQAYVDELRSWVENIQAGRPVSPTGQDGLVALRLALAAEESVRRDGSTIRLDAATGEMIKSQVPKVQAPANEDDEPETSTPSDTY